MYRRFAAYHDLVPLLLRLGVGLIFVVSGYGKIAGGVDRVAGFFGSLGIPLPSLMAPFISYLELLGGIALILGALTRVFGFLFICTMVVAIFSAKLPAFSKAPTFPAGFNEIRVALLLLLCGACLVILGAGKYSVDAALLGDRPQPISETQPRLRT